MRRRSTSLNVMVAKQSLTLIGVALSVAIFGALTFQQHAEAWIRCTGAAGAASVDRPWGLRSKRPQWRRQPIQPRAESDQALPPASPGTQYNCDDDAECVVEPCDPKEGCRTSLNVRIDDKWYDLSGWRKAHPAGAHWIDYYDGRDATEVFHAFHTDRARDMFKRLPSAKDSEALDAAAPPVTPLMRKFRELRAKLEKDGWFKRDIGEEVRMLSIWAALTVGGAICARGPPGPLPVLGTLFLALGNTQAGWLGHDYSHGVDAFSQRFRFMGPFAAGLSPNWWSDKHNKHHALTNEVGVDEDIATDPVLYVRPPDPSRDSFLRKIQHWTCFGAFSLLFVIWRFDSFKVALKEIRKKKPRPGSWSEIFWLTCHWACVFTFIPMHIIPVYILLSGVISSTIVTSTHQSEEMFEEFNPDFVHNQFQTTRDATTRTRFTQWLWGGMQYQLEHHLFPAMPRSKYPALQPIIMQFAKENKVPGGLRISDELDLVRLNWRTYANVASSDAMPGAPATRGRAHHVSAVPA